MNAIVNAIHVYGPVVILALVALLLVASVVLASVAHAVAEWDPAKATKIRRVAAVLSAVWHGVEGFALKMPGTVPADLALADAAKVQPVAKVGPLALLFLLASLPAHADPWSALMPGVALNPMPAAVDDPGAREQGAVPRLEARDGAPVNAVGGVESGAHLALEPRADGATLAPQSRASGAHLAHAVLVADASPPVAVPPGAANLPAPVVADCSACARDLVPASKWPWWGTLLISIAASGAAVADHWLTRVAS